MHSPLATMPLALVVTFVVRLLPWTPAAAMPALAALPRPVPAPVAGGGHVDVRLGRPCDEAARQDRHGNKHQEPRRELPHCRPPAVVGLHTLTASLPAQAGVGERTPRRPSPPLPPPRQKPQQRIRPCDYRADDDGDDQAPTVHRAHLLSMPRRLRSRHRLA